MYKYFKSLYLLSILYLLDLMNIPEYESNFLSRPRA